MDTNTVYSPPKMTRQEYLLWLQTDVKARNAKYTKMTPAQRRVAIAKDVIDSIQADLLKPQEGVYVSAYTKTCNIEKGKSLQDSLLPNIETCECCAKGALFMTKILSFNHYKANSGYELDSEYEETLKIDGPETMKGLNDCFSKKQLDLIENAFECDRMNADFGNRGIFYYPWLGRKEMGYEPIYARAGAMYLNYDNWSKQMRDDLQTYGTEASAKLLEICRNIITHKGTFVVPKSWKGMNEDVREVI